MGVTTRLYKVLPYDGGNVTRYNIPRQHFLSRLRLRVKLGALSGGTNGVFVAGAANKVVKRIELTIGGQLTPRGLSFENLRRLNLLAHKDNLPSDGYAYLDLGLLPAHLFTSLELLITWETVQNLQTGDRTTLNATTLEIYAREVINEGQAVGKLPLYITKTVTKDLKDVSGEQSLDLLDGNILQAILIVPSSPTLIKTVSIRQDGIKFHRAAEPYDALREENKADFEWDDVQADFVVVNFDVFGDGSQSLATKGMDTLELVFDTNSEPDGKVELVLVEIAQPQ
jgi:hypothetical protein